MARAMATDPFHNMRFQVTAAPVGGLVNPLGEIEAGFTNATLPTKSIENVEYKEGTMSFRRKYPGEMTLDDVTFTRGVSKEGTEFLRWVESTQTGKEYRADLSVFQYHREDISGTEAGSPNLTIGGAPSRIITLKEAFPISVKPGSDLDSLSSDISLQEVTCSIEDFSVTNSRTNGIA